MTGSDFAVEIDPRDLRRLATDVRRFTPALRLGVQHGLEKVAAEDVSLIQRRLMSRPYRRDVGLAAGLAAGVRWGRARGGTATGVQVSATADRLPPQRRLMLYAFNRDTFRHLVYGHADRVVTQSGRPYFRAVLEQRDRDAAAAKAVGVGVLEAAATIHAGVVA